VGHDAQLHSGPLRVGQRHDPAVIHDHLQPKHARVEGFGLLQRLTVEVGNYSNDRQTLTLPGCWLATRLSDVVPARGRRRRCPPEHLPQVQRSLCPMPTTGG
jgi:hypothetical protein